MKKKKKYVSVEAYRLMEMERKFLARHPEWVDTRKNAQMLVKIMEEHDFPTSLVGLEMAYQKFKLPPSVRGY